MSIYQRAYKRLTKLNKNLKEEWKPVGSGLERHRILPAHRGGQYDDSNCTYLTRKQHIFAHWLLWKIHGDWGDLAAINLLKGVKNYPSRLGVEHTDETRAKMSESQMKRKRGPYKKKVKISPETLQ